MVKHEKKAHLQLIDIIYNNIPAFTDLFDEDNWYTFVGCFVATTIAVAFIMSRFITLKPVEW